MRAAHYVVNLAEPIEPAEWFRLVRQLKKEMSQRGIKVDEFGDSFALDREAIKRQPSINYFEGFVQGPEWRQEFRDFFRRHAIAAQVTEPRG
jgi:hypothetical protein